MRDIGPTYDPVSQLDLTLLRYFRAVARSGSMTAAAKRLRVSQPTLSVAMKNLEATLGTSLLLRGPRGVALTRTGEELARHADEVFLVLQRAGERIRGLEAGEVGRFVVGCYHSFGAFFLPEFLRGMVEGAPGIELSLWEGTADEVRNAAVERVVDFGVGVSPRPHPDLVLAELFREVMGVFAAAPDGRGRCESPLERLRRGPLLYVQRIYLSRKVVEALGARGLLPERLLPCGDLELAKSLALRGVGPAILPSRVAAYNLPPGALSLLDSSLPYEVDQAFLFYRADLHRTRAALRVKEALLRRGAELDADRLPCGVGGVEAASGRAAGEGPGVSAAGTGARARRSRTPPRDRAGPRRR
jgi:DNA-binding transcriptional LysR family regulator